MADEDWQRRVRTVWWEIDAQGAAVCLVDQTLLPQQVSYLHLRHEHDVAEAITTLKVRGAPAIGVTAAFGIALGLYRFCNRHRQQEEQITSAKALAHVKEVGALLGSTRPTALNLFWAIARMIDCAEEVARMQATAEQMLQRLSQEAQAIADEDAEACWQMGQYGATLISDGDILLTHCNAGALATAGIGTALAPIYTAHKSGKHIHVYVDETRPVLQGARLTAWELQQEGVPLTLIADNMAGHFMRHGGIRAVFVGADRIAGNGDVANKIGTYSVAVLASVHQIPFYVVAPCATIDLTLASGEQIPIEKRPLDEVTTMRGIVIAPAGVRVANPAFDVTPHQYVTAIITERGIARPNYEETLRQHCRAKNPGKVDA